MRVLVLDGNENQAVAAARSLGRAGHEVVVGSNTAWSKAGWSRFSARSFRYVSQQVDADAFCADVVRVAAERPGSVILPMTERSTLILSERRSLLDAVSARYVFPEHASLLSALDKHATTALAASLGVPTPVTALLRTDDEANRFAQDAPYPVVLKPRASEELGPGGATRSTGKPLYARDAREFLDGFREIRRRASEIVAQEFVEGTGAGYFVLMSEGNVLAEFAHRRIRDVRPTGSGSAVRESVPVDDAVRDASLPILRALNWRGVAMVEFRRRPDGTPLFLEVNGRFWNSLALPVHSGVDFPLLLARLAAGEEITPVLQYRTGVRCRWWLGDARHLIAVLLGPPPGFRGHFPGRLQTLRDVLVPVPGTFHDNFSLDDPLPEIGDWLDFFGRRLPGVMRRRRASEPAQEP